MTDVTVNTVDMRQALAAVVAHASADKDSDRLVRVRLEVTGQNVVLTATQGFTYGLAIVSVLDNSDGELGSWDMSPVACKDVLAMFKVPTDLVDDAALRFRTDSEHIEVQDVGGLFPGKTITLPRMPDHDQFPDVAGIVGQTVHEATWRLDEGVATSGPFWAVFVAAMKAYKATVHLSAAPPVAERTRLVVQVGESFIGLLMGSSDSRMVSDLRAYRDRDWPARLPHSPREGLGVDALAGEDVTVTRADSPGLHVVSDDGNDLDDDFGGDES